MIASRGAKLAMHGCALLPSLSLLERAPGKGAALGVLLAAVAPLWLVERASRSRWRWSWSTAPFARGPLLLSIFALLLVAAAIAIVYPRLDVHTAGHGSDRDDALDQASRALVSGRFPYAERTYLGNEITPLPGAILLNVPALPLGGIAYMNVAWLGLFFVVAAAFHRSSASGLIALCGLLATPSVAVELATGGDLVSNGIYFSAALLLFAHAVERPGRSGLQAVAAALLGLVASSRFNFLMAVVPALAFAHRRLGPMHALRLAAICAGTFVVVTVPFLAHAPTQFGPLHVVHQYDRMMKGAGLVAGVCGAAAALGVVRSTLTETSGGTLVGAALVAATPPLTLCALSLIAGFPGMFGVIASRILCVVPLAIIVLARREPSTLDAAARSRVPHG